MTTAGYVARDDPRLLRGARTVENSGFDLTARRRESADPIAIARHDVCNW
jgi:hypothetical protein